MYSASRACQYAEQPARLWRMRGRVGECPELTVSRAPTLGKWRTADQARSLARSALAAALATAAGAPGRRAKSLSQCRSQPDGRHRAGSAISTLSCARGGLRESRLDISLRGRSMSAVRFISESWSTRSPGCSYSTARPARRSRNPQKFRLDRARCQSRVPAAYVQNFGDDTCSLPQTPTHFQDHARCGGLSPHRPVRPCMSITRTCKQPGTKTQMTSASHD